MQISSRQTRAWRAGVALAAACLATTMFGGPALRGGRALAQEKPTDKQAATAVVADLDDIDRLRVLNPLKLEPDQIDKLVAALTSAQADYEKKVNSLGAGTFGPVASEARDVKRQVLTGGAIPRDFDDKIKKIQTDFLKQRDDLNTANIKAVAAACRSVLTDRQVTVATKLERDQWNKDHPDVKDATDTQLFNLYCVDLFIANPRAIPLLKEMRAAAKP
jgi:hypothetical protein